MATGLIVNVGADTTDFKTEIRELPKEFEKAEQEIEASAGRANTAIGSIFKGLMSAGTLVAIERTINHFDKVADAASKYGATAEDIQRVGQAAEMTGSTIDTVAMAMERAGVAAAKAARGNEEFVEKFNRAGIDAVAFSTADLTERVEMVARAQQEAGNSGDRHAAILETVGDAAAGIDFQRIADEMGNVTVASNETVERLSQANDRINNFKNRVMVWGAEVLNFFGEIGERIATMGIAMEKNPLSFTPDPLAGATAKELKELQERYSALGLLANKGITNATEEQIQREIEAMKEREEIANRPPPSQDTNDALDGKNVKTEQNTKMRQRLLEISLQLKEAEAANNSELVAQLKYQEDLYKGILKYKDAEDAYGMAVREANAELAKRNQMLGNKFSPATQLTSAGLTNKLNSSFSRTATIDPAIQAMWSMPKMTDKEYNERARKLKEANLSHKAYGDALDALNSERLNRGRGGPFVDPKFRNMVNDATLTESERRRAEANARAANIDPATQADKIATETTLQKVANFLEQLNTKLPQPVLV